MSCYIEVTKQPDWSAEKSIAFDIFKGDARGSRTRIFFPKSLSVEKDGVLFVSEWVISKKKEELRSNGFSPEFISEKFSEIFGYKRIKDGQDGTIEAGDLLQWFDQAATNLNTPKVSFEIDGETIRFARKGNRSKSPGVIEVTNGLGWGDMNRIWFGTIKRDGTFFPSRSSNGAVASTVKRFNSNPEGFVEKAQKNAGNCCFCMGELTHERSRVAGYGPKCAKNYNLNW